MKRSFKNLSALEVLALAVSLEEEDGRILQEMAVLVREKHPRLAEAIQVMRAEEDDHRRMLTGLYQSLYGEHIPLIRREDVSGFVYRTDYQKLRRLTPHQVMDEIAVMELETRRFYERAAATTEHVASRKLFADLAEIERQHEDRARARRDEAKANESEISEPSPERTERQLFVLQVVQPSLVGLMDGSVSTLAPVFAAAVATGKPHTAFLVGVASAVGAAISMGFAEGLSDDGSLTGRGKPLLRGLVTGGMTFVGGILHTLPFLIPDFAAALWVAGGVVVLELFAIAYIRNRWMETPLLRSLVQVVVGGALVFAAGWLIGHG